MAHDVPLQTLQLQSLITSTGELRLSLARIATPEPGPDEVLVRMQATPINPSDLGLLLGPADPESARVVEGQEAAVVTLTIPQQAMASVAARLDKPMPVGNEGAGLVVKAGTSTEATNLLGQTVAIAGGAMFAQYRAVKAPDCLRLPEGATAAEGASSYVNPLTALGMVQTMRMEGHKALVHTAAASNLGQMLNRICLKDGIGLVNIVRSPNQVGILRQIGATHIVDSSAASFMNDLTEAVAQTGATLGFDAIGGGRLAGQILSAMEAYANQGAAYSRYGSNTLKQVYIYGALDGAPTEIVRDFGFTWSVGGWLLTPFLASIGREATQALRARISSELRTTFASSYSKVISLRQVLDPAEILQFSKRATGAKYLIDPSL